MEAQVETGAWLAQAVGCPARVVLEIIVDNETNSATINKRAGVRAAYAYEQFVIHPTNVSFDEMSFSVPQVPAADTILGCEPRPPRGLLLDFGAVLSVSFFERHRSTEEALGLSAGSLTWLGPIDPSTDSLWQAMQRDEITEREYWARRAKEMGETVGERDWDVRGMLSRVRQSDPRLVLRPDMLMLVDKAWARGVKVSILSNELELFYGSEFVARLKELVRLESIVDATSNSILKPDPRSYALAIESMNLPAHDILFVDDQFRNIAGAVKVNLQTQYFDLRDVPGQIAAIAARLGLPQ